MFLDFMEKMKMQFLSIQNHNWKVLLDLLYVLPFVPTVQVVETYEQEILGRIDEMKAADENPFGSRAAEGYVGTWRRTGLGHARACRRRGPLSSCTSGGTITLTASVGMH
jgi:hypothetical protein